jgi:hypothetical protein
MLRLASLLAALAIGIFSGCGQSHRQLSDGYYLERFDENGAFYTVYYVGARGKPVNGGGVFDGTVQEIGWNNDWILAHVKRVYRGDPDGWYVLNVKTGQIAGPVQSSELKTNPAFSNIKTMQPTALFLGGS